MSADVWKLSLPCTRAEGEALGGEVPALDALDTPPVIVATEPDETRPDNWRVDAYFEGPPPPEALALLASLVPSLGGALPAPARVADDDWVTLSQQGLEPVRVGRFHIRTPDHPGDPGAIELVIPAGLAFGTGQHATTSGCLAALDRLHTAGSNPRTILDLGTGTGLLAFAAARLWPAAMVFASDIDPVAIDVVRDNAALNGIEGLTLAVADGLSDPRLADNAPYDLVIANILAQPLIDMAAMIARAVAPGGTLLLAGLLDTQAGAVADAYRAQGLILAGQGAGEWPVLELSAPAP